MRIPLWILRLWSWVAPSRKVVIVRGDTPPDIIPNRNLFLAREGKEDWAVAFMCPCGCGDRLELLLVPEVKPRWSMVVHDNRTATLYPSVWRTSNCRSHFWIKKGKVVWC